MVIRSKLIQKIKQIDDVAQEVVKYIKRKLNV